MTERRPESDGPVPVRDLLRGVEPEPPDPGEPAAEAGETGEAGPDAASRERSVEFEMSGVAWVAREAGGGAYGTGRLGAARLAAIHFYRADAPETPVREALIPAGTFIELYPEELVALYGRATPIDLDRD